MDDELVEPLPAGDFAVVFLLDEPASLVLELELLAESELVDPAESELVDPAESELLDDEESLPPAGVAAEPEPLERLSVA